MVFTDVPCPGQADHVLKEFFARVPSPQTRHPVSEPTPDRATLAREDVLSGARAVVAAEGLAGLSMRRLAEHLEVWPTSIYHALGPGGKDRLLEETVDSIVAAMPIAPEQAPWDARLRGWCEGMRQGLLPYPGVAGWMLTGPVTGPASIRHTECLLRILRDVGLLREDRARFLVSIFTLILSSVHSEVGESHGSRRLTHERHFQESYARALAAVPHEESMLTRDLRDWLATATPDGQYRWGLELILRDLDVRHRAARAVPQRRR